MGDLDEMCSSGYHDAFATRSVASGFPTALAHLI
jgi:hypothetical protein